MTMTMHTPEDLTLDWRHRAECRDADPDELQPEVASAEDVAAAIGKWCAGCPVRLECRELGRLPGAYGIHGGEWCGEPPRDPAADLCGWCEEPLDAERSTAAYCSTRCRVAAHRARQALSA